jgi:hypothetical protein
MAVPMTMRPAVVRDPKARLPRARQATGGRRRGLSASKTLSSMAHETRMTDAAAGRLQTAQLSRQAYRHRMSGPSSTARQVLRWSGGWSPSSSLSARWWARSDWWRPPQRVRQVSLPGYDGSWRSYTRRWTAGPATRRGRRRGDGQHRRDRGADRLWQSGHGRYARVGEDRRRRHALGRGGRSGRRARRAAGHRARVVTAGQIGTCGAGRPARLAPVPGPVDREHGDRRPQQYHSDGDDSGPHCHSAAHPTGLHKGERSAPIQPVRIEHRQGWLVLHARSRHGGLHLRTAHAPTQVWGVAHLRTGSRVLPLRLTHLRERFASLTFCFWAIQIVQSGGGA